MQQRVSSQVRRAPPRQGTQNVMAPQAPKKKTVSIAARVFYFMRWAYHFITPLGMIIMLWGIVEAGLNDNFEKAWPLIVGGALFTYCANYFNKAR